MGRGCNPELGKRQGKAEEISSHEGMKDTKKRRNVAFLLVPRRQPGNALVPEAPASQSWMQIERSPLVAAFRGGSLADTGIPKLELGNEDTTRAFLCYIIC